MDSSLVGVHLSFSYDACFKQGVPWHSGNYRVWIHSETHMWHGKNIQSFFCIIQCNIGSCCVHITGDRNLFMRVFQSISPSASCVCVPVYVIPNWSTTKKPFYLCQTFSRLDALLYKKKQGAAGTKAPRLKRFTSLISLSKITHYMWCDHIFSQRNKATKAIKVVGKIFEKIRQYEG